MKRPGTLILALSLIGCSFTEVPPPPSSIAVNECESTDECHGGRCVSGICESSRTTIETLLVEVGSRSTDSQLGGMTFYTHVEGHPGTIAVGPVGTVTTTIGADLTDPSTCWYEGPPPVRGRLQPSHGTIPARITFVPSELETLGIAAPTYLATTGPGGTAWRFGEDDYFATTDLPPGDYDIYIEPRLLDDQSVGGRDCEAPPLLIRRHGISGTTTLAVALPVRTLLELTIRGPTGDQTLDGWSVDVVDSITGKLLSVPYRLTAPTQSDAGSDYEATVSFVPAHTFTDGKLVVDEALEGHEIIRISPPATIIAPTFLFERLGVDLSAGPDIIDLTPPGANSTLVSPIPPIAHIEGQVTEKDTGQPVEAAITLAASSIKGASNRASFVTTIQVGEDGLFKADVPPGTYWVRADPPPSLGYAAAQDSWDILPRSETQAGKTIEIPRAPSFRGQAHLSGVGGPAFGATASAVLSPLGVRTTVLQRAMLGAEVNQIAPPLPRTQAGVVARDGSFEFGADPGIYDFFVKPEERSNYSWFVSPMVEMPSGALNLDLGRLKLPLPFVYHGAVIISGTPTRVPVPGALVRAYAYLTVGTPPDLFTFVVPVAETRTDENGAFNLLIPASLDGG
jgi:hypothetical protein